MASYNEISGRYAKMEEQIYLPQRLRTQKTQNYQYQLLEEEKSRKFLLKIEQLYQKTFALYQELLENGVAKEHARIILPAALYTQFYWTINARSLMNFLALRLDSHAQEEIRLYAKEICRTFQQKMPWTYEAFDRYLLNKDEKP
jgi:thymidylate synthase (FAD)